MSTDTRVCGAEDCEVSLAGKRRDAKWCSPRCRQRQNAGITKPDTRVCAAEDCENSLAGQRSHARYCSQRCHQRRSKGRTTPDTRVCAAEDCENSLAGRRRGTRTKYCSTRCCRKTLERHRHRRYTKIRQSHIQNDTRICAAEGCANSLAGKQASAKYCSPRCSLRAWHKRQPKPPDTRICATEGCTNSLAGKRSDAKCCSTECVQLKCRGVAKLGTRTCDAEGCNNSLDGKLRHAKYCSAECRTREINQRNRHLRRARKRNAQNEYTTAQKVEDRMTFHAVCWYCGTDCGDDYHVDHVIPLSRGGAHLPANLVKACPGCNLSKNARSLVGFLGLRWGDSDVWIVPPHPRFAEAA